MSKFKYKIQNKKGELIEEIVEAEDKYVLASELRGGGNNVIFVEEVTKKHIFNMEKINQLLSRVKLQEKITFARNLSAMIAAGLSVSRGMSVLERQTNNPKLKKVIKNLSEEVSKGNTLSGAMKKESKVFSSLFVSMVHAGEESGNLAESLNVISLQLEKSYSLRKKIKGAMMYPAIVLTAMIVIGVLMFVFVVPTLTATFESLDTELPATTKAIILLSDVLLEHYVIISLSVLLLISGLWSFITKTRKGKRYFHFFVLHIPLISKLVKEANAARTARTLSSLLASGVDIMESLSITQDVLQNVYYKDVLKKAEKNVQKGIALSAVFAENEKIYPVLVGEMIAVGEETGKLSDMLLRIADFYEDEVDIATKNLSTIIEPFLMVVIGAGVGLFAVSMISPMYSLVDSI